MITRFAPSPTGPLHLGHAYAAILAYDMAREAGGRFLLRIEDLDRSRARPEWERAIEEDLHWLGLEWPQPVLRQSERMKAYAGALDLLWEMGLLYPCRCNRRDIAEAASAPQEGAAPRFGPDGLVYPGTCRPDADNRPASPRPADAVLRLDLGRALRGLGEIAFAETGPGEGATVPAGGVLRRDHDRLLAEVGDVVLARRGMGSSYHLAVVLDDAAQGVTLVTRGADLQEATWIHVVLQRLLGLPAPVYHHHRLVRDEAGKRLAKRDDARALARYRAEGHSPAEIRALLGLTPRRT